MTATKPTNTEILDTVAAITGATVAEIVGRSRTNRIARARYLAMAAITNANPHWSLLDVSGVVGKADHSTIYHGLCRYRELYETDAHFRNMAQSLGLNAKIRANYQVQAKRRGIGNDKAMPDGTKKSTQTI